MSSLAEFDCKEFRKFMWRLSVTKVPKKKEDELRTPRASMVGADTFGDDLFDQDWDLLDEESWKRICAGDCLPLQGPEAHPENWWEEREYYDADYTLPVPDKDGLDL